LEHVGPVSGVLPDLQAAWHRIPLSLTVSQDWPVPEQVPSGMLYEENAPDGSDWLTGSSIA
jgi:hypothetical protein